MLTATTQAAAAPTPTPPGSLDYGYVLLIVGAVTVLAAAIAKLWHRDNAQTVAQIRELKAEVVRLRDARDAAQSDAATARRQAAVAKLNAEQNETNAQREKAAMLQAMNSDQAMVIECLTKALGERS